MLLKPNHHNCPSLKSYLSSRRRFQTFRVRMIPGEMANNTSDNKASFHQKTIHDVTYSIGFSVIVLVALIIISYISYRCNRSWSSAEHTAFSVPIRSSRPPAAELTDVSSEGGGVGIDEATLLNYPKFQYSQAKNLKGRDPTASGCSICLADYKDSDTLRLLPDCGHLFHLKCIDPWLKLHPTCPICRSSPMPTPLAEAAPLSMHRI